MKLHPAPAGEGVLDAQRPDQARGIEGAAHVKRDAAPPSRPCTCGFRSPSVPNCECSDTKIPHIEEESWREEDRLREEEFARDCERDEAQRW